MVSVERSVVDVKINRSGDHPRRVVYTPIFPGAGPSGVVTSGVAIRRRVSTRPTPRGTSVPTGPTVTTPRQEVQTRRACLSEKPTVTGVSTTRVVVVSVRVSVTGNELETSTFPSGITTQNLSFPSVPTSHS